VFPQFNATAATTPAKVISTAPRLMMRILLRPVRAAPLSLPARDVDTLNPRMQGCFLVRDPFRRSFH
jgi:hypothetical protein